jgi:hypothetical protein
MEYERIPTNSNEFRLIPKNSNVLTDSNEV